MEHAYKNVRNFRARVIRGDDRQAPERYCSGSIQQPPYLPLGSSIGQIGAPQPRGRNLLRNSAQPTVGAGLWVLAGTASLLLQFPKVFDGGFVPAILGGPAGVNDTITSPPITLDITPGQEYAASAVFSGDLNFLIGQCSQRSKMAVVWRDAGNVVLRTDSIEFSGVNGQIFNVSNPNLVVNPTAAGFVAELITGGVPGLATGFVQCFQISFACFAPVNTNNALLVITPLSGAASAINTIIAGGFQLEHNFAVSDFVPTPLTTSDNAITKFRTYGAIPRQNSDRSYPLRGSDSGNNFTYEYGTDNDKSFLVNTAAATVTIPNHTSINFDVEESINIINSSAGNITINGGGAVTFFGPGFAAAGVNTFVMPPPPAPGQFSAIKMILSVVANVTQAFLVDSNIGVFSAAGAIAGVPAPGAAGTIVRSNGAAWVASTSTYFDTIANGNIPFASAANALSSGTPNLVYTTAGGLQVNNLVDISQAAGGQIKFPAAQNASANANTLDDYSKGTWTPVDSSGAGLVFAAASGRYTKIGNTVTLTYRVAYPATVNAASMLIGGLPYTPNADANPGGGPLSYNSAGVATIVLGSAVSTSATNFILRTTGNATPVNSALSNVDVRGTISYLT